MTEIETGSTPRTVLSEMRVFSYNKPSNHSGFDTSHPVGQYKVVRNNQTEAFEPYAYSEKKPKFPKVIVGEIGRQKLKEVANNPNEYLQYYATKQEYFATWICDYYENNIKTNSSYKLPNFICFGGRLADALITPCKFKGEWDFHAARFLDSVFLWADPKYSQKNLATKLKNGLAFEALRTGTDLPKSPIDFIGKKPLAVHERMFGKFSLLLVSDIDAEDDKENWVELKIFADYILKKIDGSSRYTDNTLSCWSQCVVSNSQRVVIGQYDKDDFLTNNLRDCTLLEYQKMIHVSETDLNLCYDFLQRLLKFVREQFKLEEPKCPKQFVWKSSKLENKNNQTVKCVQAPKEEIPVWFTDMYNNLKRIDTKDAQ